MEGEERSRKDVALGITTAPTSRGGKQTTASAVTKKWRRGGMMPRGAPDILRPAGSLSSHVRLCNKLSEPEPELGLWSEALALVSMLPQLPDGWSWSKILRFSGPPLPLRKGAVHTERAS